MRIYSLVSEELKQVEREMEMHLAHRPPEVYGMLIPFIRQGGKRIRPALLLLGCKALGGDMAAAVRVSTLLEMFHNFTLIHDDIMDNSSFRRGTPTLHRSHGIGIALNAGDALYTLVWNELLKIKLPTDAKARVQKTCGEAFARVVEGQGNELEWHRQRRFDIRMEDYYRMVGGKTAVLIGLSCRLAAILSHTPAYEKNLQRFGEKLGLAFQIQDDVLNLLGTFNKYKKKIGEDIAEGKRTLMVIDTLQQATPAERKRLAAILANGKYHAPSVRYAIRLFKKYRTIERTQAVARRLVEEAKREIGHLPESAEKQALIELADFVISREE